jgi:diguanylate cyclase (GGDEF)-like protein
MSPGSGTPAAGAHTAAGGDPLREVLDWERAMLCAATLPELLAVAADHGGGHPARIVTLLLCDPGHELRHLLLGGERAQPPAGLMFTDSLVGHAPQLALLREPWRGDFCVADHGVLFPERSGIGRVVLFPLFAREAQIGCLSLGLAHQARLPGEDEPWLLAHVGDVMSSALERLLGAMRLHRAGLTHPLTGWHTRRYLQARLAEAIARCQRYGGDVSCVLIDVDGLRAVNDAYGQLAGDQALCEIAARIEGQLRASDAAAHIDSDEFVVLLPDTRTAAAVPLAERILDAIRSEPVTAGQALSLPMSVSIGVAAVTAGPDSVKKTLSDQLLAKAQAALHMAKARGGNRYTLGDP